MLIAPLPITDGAYGMRCADVETLRVMLSAVSPPATSLAGPSGAYLVKHGFQKANTVIQLNQGVNLGRPSQLFVEVKAQNDELTDVFVSGHVCKISQSTLLATKHL